MTQVKEAWFLYPGERLPSADSPSRGCLWHLLRTGPSCKMRAMTRGRTCFSPPPPRLVLRRNPVKRGSTPGFSLKSMTLHDGLLVRYLGQSVGEGGEGVVVGRHRTHEEAVMRAVVDTSGNKNAEDQHMIYGDGDQDGLGDGAEAGVRYAACPPASGAPGDARSSCWRVARYTTYILHSRRPSRYRYSLCRGNRVCMYGCGRGSARCASTKPLQRKPCQHPCWVGSGRYVVSSRCRCPAGITGLS